VLELAILGLLKEQALHGYELKKRLPDALGGATGVSFGSLYPALARLERTGAVTVIEVGARPQPESIPLTGSLAGELAAFRARRVGSRGTRARKVYCITPAGEALFDELLRGDSQPGDDARLFGLRWAFARYLPSDARLGMLERRRAHLQARLGHLAARVRAGRDRLDAYARSLLEHDQEVAEHDLSWIDRLIASERTGQSREENPGGNDPALRIAEADPTSGAATADTTAEPAVSPPGAPPDRPSRGAPTPLTHPPRRRPRGMAAPTMSGLRPPAGHSPIHHQEDTVS
jgi:DNA-binding PadR family transcriptional regulator